MSALEGLAARLALDAMRAGLIGEEGASRRHSEVAQETACYGVFRSADGVIINTTEC
jgi:flagellar biosynthesis component FlhA